MRCARLRLLLPVLAVLAGCGPGTPPIEPPRHLLLLTVDTLRADHTAVYAYPRQTSPCLETLASEGVVFEQAIAQWPQTGPSLASLFSGRYPQSTGLTHEAVVELPPDLPILPEFLRSIGFTTAAVVSNPALASELGWSRGFDRYVQTWSAGGAVSEDPAEFRRSIAAPRVNRLALPLLEQLSTVQRLFLWIHYTDPHAPYVLPEGFDNPFLGDRFYSASELIEKPLPPPVRLGSHRELAYYVAQYDANVLAADLGIMELVERARELGLLDRSLVIYTSDHGESLGERGYYFGHGRLPYNVTARVPLVIRYPGLPGSGLRVRGAVELLDLFPTLREMLAPERGVPGLEGESLLSSLIGLEPVPDGDIGYAFSGAGIRRRNTHYRSVQDRSWKLVYHPARKKRHRPPRFELYNLVSDALETRNVVDQHPEALERLRRELFGWMEGQYVLSPPSRRRPREGEETLRALRALGYLSG